MYSTWMRHICHLTKMSEEVKGDMWELKEHQKSSGDRKTRIMRKQNGGGRVGRHANLPAHIFLMMSHGRNHYLPPDE